MLPLSHLPTPSSPINQIRSNGIDLPLCIIFFETSQSQFWRLIKFLKLSALFQDKATGLELVATLKVHQVAISSLSINPSGQVIASGGK